MGQAWSCPGGPGLTGQRQPLSGSSALRAQRPLHPRLHSGREGPRLQLLLWLWIWGQVSSTQIPQAWAQEGGPGSVTQIFPFLKLSEEAASGLWRAEWSGRGRAGNELPVLQRW